MKWFGKPWGAGLNTDLTKKIEVPENKFCEQCRKPIQPNDQGVQLVNGVCYHLDCFLEALGVGHEPSFFGDHFD
jgi:hypothetical protein